MNAEQQATLKTFETNKLPFREIYIKNINEFSIGQLMTMAISETIAACFFLEVNPFNQPAVEHGKKITKNILFDVN